MIQFSMTNQWKFKIFDSSAIKVPSPHIFDQVTMILILKYHSQSDTDWAKLVRLVLDNENLDKLKVGSDIFKVAEVVARPLPGAWEHD